MRVDCYRRQNLGMLTLKLIGACAPHHSLPLSNYVRIGIPVEFYWSKHYILGQWKKQIIKKKTLRKLKGLINTLSPCSSVPDVKTTWSPCRRRQRLRASARIAVYKWPICGAEKTLILQNNHGIIDRDLQQGVRHPSVKQATSHLWVPIFKCQNSNILGPCINYESG